ncbi:hypothetical protein QN277_010346 [Acacia crassicarpa]|uniref:Transmembrane protein n=1 Tax=Acacia crassicarpa TaxID=499986 RepID=A0AAE1M5F1_9FABA|nr:hypothetical protein QN277_010346 [Acacia crassicarpa]
MAPISAFKFFAILLAVALFSVAGSAQDFDLSPLPAPAPKSGAAGSVSSSVALIGASVILSVLAILKDQAFLLYTFLFAALLFSKHCRFEAKPERSLCFFI